MEVYPTPRKNPGFRMKRFELSRLFTCLWTCVDCLSQDNILFGAPLDEERYKKVLYQCCLERDLQLFDAGDQTEVGEKGLTLRCVRPSRLYGGQAS